MPRLARRAQLLQMSPLGRVASPTCSDTKVAMLSSVQRFSETATAVPMSVVAASRQSARCSRRWPKCSVLREQLMALPSFLQHARRFAHIPHASPTLQVALDCPAVLNPPTNKKCSHTCVFLAGRFNVHCMQLTRA